MIFDPLPVKFLPQKKLLIWAKNSPIFCSKLPRSQKWRYQKFLLHQKMAKEGSKNQKKIFSQKKYSKDGKNKFWDLWDHNFIFRKSSDRFRTLTLPPPTRLGSSHGHVPCGVSEIIAEICIFALPLHVSAGIPGETCSGRAKVQILRLSQRRRKWS